MKATWLVVLMWLIIGGLNVSQVSSVFASERNAKQQSKKQISAQQAARKVIGRFGGKLLKVSSSKNGYRVKVIKKDGRIISVFVDGRTGQIHGG